MIGTAVNPKAWRGLRYPDSDLVGLLYRFARPQPGAGTETIPPRPDGRAMHGARTPHGRRTLLDTPVEPDERALHNERPRALDAGCGAGRHVRLLQDLGYRATGIDCDPQMIEAARHNGLDAQLADARDYRPDARPHVAVCWGFMMVVPHGPAVVAGWEPQIIIADWRPRSNTCHQWPGNRLLPNGATLLHAPGHLLHGLEYYFHDLAECVIPGYERVHWQHVIKRTTEESNEWIQTVFRRS